MKTDNLEIDKAYNVGDMVTVCWEDSCTAHRLYFWGEDKGVSHKKRSGYANFTHSICDTHFQQYQEELDILIAEEHAAAEAVIAQEVAVPVAAS